MTAISVYVESNFLLELVFEQGESGACEELLVLAEQKAIRLVVPCLALIEPEWTLKKESKKRRDAGNHVELMLGGLRRNLSLGSESQRLGNDLGALLTLCEQEEELRIQKTRERLLTSAVVLVATGDVLHAAVQAASAHDLELFDSMILASVLMDLSSRVGENSCFLNRNTKDFATPSVRQELQARGCKFIPNFDDGLAHVLANVGDQKR